MDTKLQILEQSIRFTKIGKQAVRKAQEESRRKGVPNVIMFNDRIYYEKPDGSLTLENILQK